MCNAVFSKQYQGKTTTVIAITLTSAQVQLELRIWLILCYGVEVVINGAAKEIGRAAVIAVTKARGMEVAGAVDSHLVGQDIGKVSL